jgi:hypothetical protein
MFAFGVAQDRIVWIKLGCDHAPIGMECRPNLWSGCIDVK